jgi:hypothetical protein
MSFLAFEYTSAQMLVAAVLAFILLVAVAAWFYWSASAEEAKPAPGSPASAPKPTVNTPKTFIPVVRPPSRPAGRPSTAPVSNGEVRATPRTAPAEPVTEIASSLFGVIRCGRHGPFWCSGLGRESQGEFPGGFRS